MNLLKQFTQKGKCALLSVFLYAFFFRNGNILWSVRRRGHSEMDTECIKSYAYVGLRPAQQPALAVGRYW